MWEREESLRGEEKRKREKKSGLASLLSFVVDLFDPRIPLTFFFAFPFFFLLLPSDHVGTLFSSLLCAPFPSESSFLSASRNSFVLCEMKAALARLVTGGGGGGGGDRDAEAGGARGSSRNAPSSPQQRLANAQRVISDPVGPSLSVDLSFIVHEERSCGGLHHYKSARAVARACSQFRCRRKRGASDHASERSVWRSGALERESFFTLCFFTTPSVCFRRASLLLWRSLCSLPRIEEERERGVF